MTTTRLANRNILISGAGIAGPALAHWLHRYGFNPTVVERAPAPRSGGYKVDLRGAAVEVAARMGLLADIQRAHTDMRGGSIIDSTGRTLATMDSDLVGFRAEGDLEVLRGDLAQILHSATRNDVEYVFGDSITAIRQTDQGVDVTFERGAARRFDLVVGADGQHSRVRSLAFGPESGFAHELGHYVSIFTVPNYLDLDRWELFYSEPGRSVNVYSTRDSADAKAAFFFASPPLNYDRADVARQKQLVANAFAGAGWEVSRLLGHLNQTSDFYLDSLSVIRMDRWSTGRAVLLGDAAYGASPASGQGTSLALVGAYVLAGELLAAGGDYRAGFAGYHDQMRKFVAENQKLADNIKRIVMSSRTQIWLQTRMLRMLPHLPWKNLMTRKIVEQITAVANGIDLKDYAQAALPA